jgi:hypothetical protein
MSVAGMGTKLQSELVNIAPQDGSTFLFTGTQFGLRMASQIRLYSDYGYRISVEQRVDIAVFCHTIVI